MTGFLNSDTTSRMISIDSASSRCRCRGSARRCSSAVWVAASTVKVWRLVARRKTCRCDILHDLSGRENLCGLNIRIVAVAPQACRRPPTHIGGALHKLGRRACCLLVGHELTGLVLLGGRTIGFTRGKSVAVLWHQGAKSGEFETAEHGIKNSVHCPDM